MVVRVADTCVLIDLERGGLASCLQSRRIELAVPDLVYANHFPTDGAFGTRWPSLRVEILSAAELHALQAFRKAHRCLSVSDGAVLALARSRGWPVLAGDSRLIATAQREGVPVNDLLWVFDELYVGGLAEAAPLANALRAIAARPASRVPIEEINARLRAYS